ncbi:hypothetical protein LZ31DRAFT_632576 [Colletotrichum somersetense]|nr:hypothetical protein LZ31DRAFT_632576 [Colletotrichum somersetense]
MNANLPLLLSSTKIDALCAQCGGSRSEGQWLPRTIEASLRSKTCLAFWDGAFGFDTAAVLEADHLDTIYSNEYVEAFKRCDKAALSALKVPFNTLLALTEAAVTQKQAVGVAPQKPIAIQSDSRNRYREAMAAGVPVYLLHPQNFLEYGEARNWDVKFTSTAVRQELGQCQIRRGMLTAMELPKGERTCPGKDMPPCDVQAIELAYHQLGDVAAFNTLISQYNNGAYNNRFTVFRQIGGSIVEMPEAHL